MRFMNKKLFRKVFEKFGYTWDELWEDHNVKEDIVDFMLSLEEDIKEINITIKELEAY